LIISEFSPKIAIFVVGKEIIALNYTTSPLCRLRMPQDAHFSVPVWQVNLVI
jgi:hypothetical protein